MYDPGNSLQFLQPELVGHFGRTLNHKKLNNLSWFLLVLSEVIITHPKYSSISQGEKPHALRWGQNLRSPRAEGWAELNDEPGLGTGDWMLR